MSSVALIKTCLNLLHYSGISQILRKPLRGRGSIFCLHHVVPPHHKHGEFSPNLKLEISPDFLFDIINMVREQGYETVSLTEAVSRLQTPAQGSKPFAAFTLDDGYKDNLIHAQPVFAKLNCPYTVFVAPGIVEGTAELWWRAIEKIIADNISVYAEIEGIVYSYKTESIAEKYHAWKIVSDALQAAPEYVQREITRNLAKRYEIDLKAMCLETAMTWQEIKQLADDPLCTIGAHTISHYAVRKLSLEDAETELRQSKKIISEKLCRAIEHFAYPYGDDIAAGPREFRLAEKVGFLSSVTTRKGVIYDVHKNHLQALPRVMVSGRYSKLRYVEVLMSGVPGRVINKFRAHNVD